MACGAHAAPYLQYDFEDNVSDSSGNNRHGTVSGVVGYAAGYDGGQALSLTGSGWVNLPDNTIFSNLRFTLSMWFKATSPGGLFGYQNLAAGAGVPTEYVPLLAIVADGADQGKLRAELWTNMSGMSVLSPDSVLDGQWHKVVISASPTAIVVYLDDAFIGQEEETVNHLHMYFNQVGTAKIRRPVGAGGDAYYAYSGLIDELVFTTEYLATVATESASGISSTGATVTGNLSYLGEPSPTQHGICWGTSPNPTIAGNKTQLGAADATGTYSSTLTGLTGGTTYYARAYATNAAGTAYGEEISFATGDVGLVRLFEFNGDLTDSLGSGEQLVPDGTASASFEDGAWTWTADAQPGGGLILDTASSLADHYAIGIRCKFSQVSGYRKIIDFQNGTSDRGFYFHDGHLKFYPEPEAPSTFAAGTVVDFILCRDAATKQVTVYMVSGGAITQEYQFTDTDDDAVAAVIDGKARFRLFQDDSVATGEWTPGGTVYTVRVWDGPLVGGPILSAGGSLTCEPGEAAAAIDAAVVVDHLAGLDIENGSVTITSGGSAGDVLAAATAGTNISASYNSATYVLTLTGADSAAHYQQVMRAATFAAASDAAEGIRTITYTVSDASLSATDTATVEVEAVPPTVSTSGGTAAFVVGGEAVVVDPAIEVLGPEISGLKVSVAVDSFVAGDTLAHTGELPAGVTASYDADKGILTFTGTASAAEWQAVARTVTFSTTASDAGTRTVAFAIGGALPYGDNGHFYEFVADVDSNWTAAKVLAEARTLFGLQGYLATITSQAEQDFITEKVSGVAWIGATDEFSQINAAAGAALYANQGASEGKWYWVTGPEAGTQITGSNFPATAVNGRYLNWHGEEPNNGNGGTEHYGHMMNWTDPPGRWNDVPDAGGSGPYAKQGYVVEYGGMAGDPIVQITAGRDVSVTVPTAPSVTTAAVSEVTTSTATSGGEVTADGGVAVTARGICWNTTGTPTTADSKTANGVGTGAFASSLADLSPGTTYYVRAYATNDVGTAYGAERAFTTASTISTSAGSSAYTKGNPAAVVDPGIVVEAGDVTGMKVSITEGFAAGDVLAHTGALPDGVSAAYDDAKGILTFTGTASAAAWQALLRTVSFRTTSSNASARTVAFTMGSAIPFEGNDHFYEFIADAGSNWTAAKVLAEARTLFGLQGYLATITSQAEQDFITEKVTGVAWIGATDEFSQINAAAGAALYANQAASEGKWYWVTGPEKGTQITSSNAPAVPVEGRYLNWHEGEPNNAGGAEHYAQMMNWTDPPGRWNDIPNAGGADQYAKQGYVLEYGGMAGDPSVQITAGKVVAVTIPSVPTVSTAAVSAITISGATSGGNVTADGGAAVSVRGICWNTTGMPTTADSKVANGGGTGAFTATLTGLSAGTTYYVRAYATNLAGTGYGAQVEFTATQQYTVTFVAAAGGTISGTTSQTIAHGGNASWVTAVAQDGYHFGSWTGTGEFACSDNPLMVLDVTCDMTITASFIQDPLVQVTIEPEDEGVDPQTGGVQVGQNASFLVTVSNTGGDASLVETIIPLPENTEFVSGELVSLPAAAGISGEIVLEGRNVLIRAASLPGGARIGVRLVLRPLVSGSIVLTPQVTTAEMPQPSAGEPAELDAVDEFYQVVQTFVPLGRCGQIGLVPLAMMFAGLGLMKRRTVA